jgi:MSHA pilin protein MshA
MINKGFTLIELIVVIVILGILAAVAAPKFMDLQSDARKASLQGMAASVKSAANMVKSKAMIQNIDVNGNIVELEIVPGKWW